MKSTLFLTTAIASTLIASAAWPCGMPFGVGINVDAKQDIIVVHKNGVETYVFQPTFCGTASNFGLILPVPSKLTEQPALAKAEIFKYVDTLSQPKVEKRTACFAPSDGGIAAGGNNGWKLPGATVVASGRVGFLDWAQLKAESTASFTDWLDANGFPHQSTTNDAFSYYVKKGWYFVAFKIAQEVTGKEVCNALGPIKLSFASDVPVVPSRMASAGATSTTSSSYPPGFTWRIFGISPGTDQIDFVTREYRRSDLGYSGQLTAQDAAHLDGLAGANDRLTKLSLWFGHSGITDDVALSVQPAKDFREVVYDTTYIDCTAYDAGVPHDAEAHRDADPVTTLLPVTTPDAAPISPEPVAPAPPVTKSSGGGCSFAPVGGPAGTAVPLLLGLALLGWARRRSDQP